jgi:hypothetical protein
MLDQSQDRRKLVTENGRPEAAPPWVDSAEDLVEGPNDQTAFEHDFQNDSRGAGRGEDPKQHARRNHDPQYEVGCLSDRDVAGLAVSEEPLQEPAYHFAWAPFDAASRPVAVATGLVTSLNDFDDAVRARVDENRSTVDNCITIITNPVFRRNVVVGYAIARKICAYTYIAVIRI